MPTIPPANRQEGDPTHLADHAAIVDVLTDHETRTDTVEATVGDHGSRLTTLESRPVLYVGNTAPSNPATNTVWIDTS